MSSMFLEILIISLYATFVVICILGSKQLHISYDLRSELRELASQEAKEIHSLCFPRDEDGTHIRPLIAGIDAHSKLSTILDKYPARTGLRYLFKWKMETLYPDVKEEIIRTSMEMKTFIVAWRLSGPTPTIVVQYDDINPS